MVQCVLISHLLVFILTLVLPLDDILSQSDSLKMLNQVVFWPWNHLSFISPIFHSLIIWTLGSELERALGKRTFMFSYLLYIPLTGLMIWSLNISGWHAGLLFSTHYLDVSILLVYAFLYPNREIQVFFLFKLKMKVAGPLFAGFLLLSATGLIWWATLLVLSPSLVWGFWRQKRGPSGYLNYQRPLEPMGQIYEFPLTDLGEPVVSKANLKQETFYEENEELDQLLKRVSEIGRENLTEKENARLIEISNKMKERKGR